MSVHLKIKEKTEISAVIGHYFSELQKLKNGIVAFINTWNSWSSFFSIQSVT